MHLSTTYFYQGIEYKIETEVNVTIGNNGIGSYEYWGAKCFDRGTDYVEEFELEDLHAWHHGVEVVDAELIAKIKEAIEAEDDTEPGSIWAQINEKWQASGMEDDPSLE